MYATRVNSVEKLTARVNAVAETIRQNPDMSERIHSNTRRIQACINREEQHFEQFL